MPVTDVRKDLDALTLTLVASLDAPVERSWRLWSDARQLERWWGPPAYPAKVVEHDLSPGGLVRYFMTGPEGDRYHGWWRITAADEPHRLAFEDGFADEDGNAAEGMPVTVVVVTLRPEGDGTVMEIASRFPSREAMDQLIAMGMEQGIREAAGQIDAILRARPAG